MLDYTLYFSEKSSIYRSEMTVFEKIWGMVVGAYEGHFLAIFVPEGIN
ncbi:MAG: hypothetical protein ACJAWH_000573 [Maribacter sp.]|jgi:hypothetical protein